MFVSLLMGAVDAVFAVFDRGAASLIGRRPGGFASV
jgi:hypothetical protein